jgi:ATP-dependent helicase Lhr and Lhr-like helicase
MANIHSWRICRLFPFAQGEESVKNLTASRSSVVEAPAPDSVEHWFRRRGWKALPHQERVRAEFAAGKSGLLHAPTGSGKTLALWLPILEQARAQRNRQGNGLQVLWLTPLRALARDLQRAMQEAADEAGVNWTVAAQTGDMTSTERQRLKRSSPEALVTTPESLHVMLSREGYPAAFQNLKVVVVDEWHELLHSKRGTLVELGLSRLRGLRANLQIWGVSATMANLEEALEVLLGTEGLARPHAIVAAAMRKKVTVESVLPDDIMRFPWAGHVGLRLLPKVLEIIRKGGSTLVFTNTRSNAETWHQALLEKEPELKGKIELHHGSLDTDARREVEEALHARKLKAVVCTSSLDLGVDFRPVDTAIQIGSPKGVGRFLQRAGRSGHAPGATSRIFFVPTHMLELVEPPALRGALDDGEMEGRRPLEKPLDVLVQYLTTLASGEGFLPDAIAPEVRSTVAFRHLGTDEWAWALEYITRGGPVLDHYDQFRKVEVDEEGFYRMRQRRMIQRHRLSIGTIMSDTHLRVRFIGGGSIGTVEESFAARLKPGDIFFFGGRALEFVRLRELTVWVRAGRARRGIVPRWNGGRMPLSSNLADRVRQQFAAGGGRDESPEMAKLRPILELQERYSAVPQPNQLLIERMESREGHHLFLYPFDGRLVHEGLAAVLAWRLSQREPGTFSFAMNDYGLELLSAEPVALEAAIEDGLFGEENLLEDIASSLNATEMARRQFREISRIAGLVFHGFPGRTAPPRGLQASSQLLFDVFGRYHPENLLYRQAFREVFAQRMEEIRLRELLKRIRVQEIVIKQADRFTPFSFPIMVDRLRDRLSSEKLEARLMRLQKRLTQEPRIRERTVKKPAGK